MENRPYKEMERIMIDKESIELMEEEIIIKRGIERYMYARQFVYGNVLDAACGVGYGSYLLSKNPDVYEITSIDRDSDTINHANNNFKNEKIRFVQCEFDEINGDFDILVSLETIEHHPNPEVFKTIVDKCNIKEIIISFPTKKTTHYNKHHLWDFTKEDVIRIFDSYQCYREEQIGDSLIMNLIRIDRNDIKPKRFNKMY